MIKLKSVIYLISMMTLAGCLGQKQTSAVVEEQNEHWIIGPFVRPEGVNPVISPQPTTFQCPMRKQLVKWEESDTFNPAATVKDGKIVVLYRAEDNSAQGIGKRTSRIGYAESTDGVTMKQSDAPVLFPSEDDYKEIEWEGGCEDPRVAMTEDGLYVMLYTAWNRHLPRLAVATSTDLKNWTKHGLAFAKAYNGRFANIASKSASIVTGVKDGKLVIEKVNGKYFMYWGENAVCAATSDNLTDWTPVLNENNELREIAKPRSGYFDSRLTECGPPAIKTTDGIVLLYNGKNGYKEERDSEYPAGAYCAGQFLFDADDPYQVLGRLDKPFFVPEAAFEKSGQYKDGTVFIEGLAYFKNKLYLYYGCADSQVAVAICDNNMDLKLKTHN
ncbi:FIG01423360: glycoside hydrolase [Bacteroides ovatus]|jgi:predicted GH43/DUF377 family glycosyl hydrolase|uniref:glycoside hydrolase family 130 protein n=1 Tax=Bacteroides TaxID=816 RepID=UPI000E956317|nr:MULTISPECIES: glycoside hydrolase family 130 protein [Bacteroides]MCS3175629.1 glycoside hydrolase family 130 protein [Candidatus Bacteroides intestinigallinarum]RGN64818.1 hypothetical protein DXB58_04265 [Bacteroides sp. OM05-10AA]RGQ67727.1 hypothetical protein DWY87_05905 [Bacteroides sp. AF27-33]CAG9898819.1 FIG01423360: glycoside hydrolase [Bacteroides ovatus]